MSDSQELANAYLKYINEINQQFADSIKPALDQLEITLQPMRDVSEMIQKIQENTLESLQPAMEAIREFSKQSVSVNKKITEYSIEIFIVLNHCYCRNLTMKFTIWLVNLTKLCPMSNLGM